ncbi:hypothetical protein DVH05_002853 [Phytophthora capsici]|nr:hypothetical protein DVH05_002853 [Phytophthora capsici]
MAWNTPMEEKMCVYWVEDLRMQLKRRVPGESFKMAAPDTTTVAKWVAKAWDVLDTCTISSGYKKAGPAVSNVQVIANGAASQLNRVSLISHTVGEVDDEIDFESCDEA